MDDELITFGKYKNKITKKELCNYYPGYVLFLQSQKKLSTFPVPIKKIEVSCLDELEYIDLYHIVYAILPKSWIDDLSIDPILQEMTQSSTCDSNVIISYNDDQKGIVFLYTDHDNHQLPWIHDNSYFYTKQCVIKYKQHDTSTMIKQNFEIPRHFLHYAWNRVCQHPQISYAIQRTEQGSLHTNLSHTLPLTLFAFKPISISELVPEVYIFLDTETTSLPKKIIKHVPSHLSQFPLSDYESCQLLEIAWIVKDKWTNQIYETVNEIIKPQWEHTNPYDPHLYQEANEKGKDVRWICKRLNQLLDCYPHHTLVCHNVAFDHAVIASLLAQQNSFYLYQRWTPIRSLCTMVVAAPFINPDTKKWPKLQILHDFLGCVEKIQTHRALDDVYMLIDCFESMKKLNWI